MMYACAESAFYGIWIEIQQEAHVLERRYTVYVL